MAERCPDISHRYHHGWRLCPDWFEASLCAVAPYIIIERMKNNGERTDVFGDLSRSLQSFLQEVLSQTLALVVFIDAEASEYHHGDRIGCPMP